MGISPEQIKQQLASEDLGQRLRAVNLLREIDPAVAFELIQTVTSDSSARVRYAAISQFSSLGNQDKETALTILRGALYHDPEADVQAAAADSIGALQLVEAYDDPAGVTASFNLNLLQRINRSLGADFDLSGFAHKALWNAPESRIEMHLESLVDQTVRIGDTEIRFHKGETIHTENSHKYDEEAFAEIADQGGWQVLDTDTDPDGLFSVVTLQAT